MADGFVSRQRRNSGTLLMLVQIARPLIWLLTKLYRVADQILGLDKLQAASNLGRLTKDVESQCDYLFSKYGARTIPEVCGGMPSLTGQLSSSKFVLYN